MPRWWQSDLQTAPRSPTGPDKSQFVDITKVKANVKKPKAENDATTGTFTVNCGKNENGHFNPDNFIAQPGVRNGAEHLHDYVGNLSTNADSNNKSLQKAGTTCKNGDKSAYFWPVVRINDGEEAEEAEQAEQEQAPPKKDDKAQQDKDKADKAAARLECPDVASPAARGRPRRRPGRDRQGTREHREGDRGGREEARVDQGPGRHQLGHRPAA